MIDPQGVSPQPHSYIFVDHNIVMKVSSRPPKPQQKIQWNDLDSISPDDSWDRSMRPTAAFDELGMLRRQPVSSTRKHRSHAGQESTTIPVKSVSSLSSLLLRRRTLRAYVAKVELYFDFTSSWMSARYTAHRLNMLFFKPLLHHGRNDLIILAD